MRCSLPAVLVVLLIVSGCGAPTPPAPAPLEEPPRVEPPTPPPAKGGVLLPQEPLPEVEVPAPEPTPAPIVAPPEPPTPPPASRSLGRITIDEAVLADGVVDRQPTGLGDRFPLGTEVHCFVRVTNPHGRRTLRHRWFYDGKARSTIDLTVRSPSWRTWSSRAVHDRGAWRVDVLDESDAVLASLPFTVQ